MYAMPNIDVLWCEYLFIPVCLIFQLQPKQVHVDKLWLLAYVVSAWDGRIYFKFQIELMNDV